MKLRWAALAVLALGAAVLPAMSAQMMSDPGDWQRITAAGLGQNYPNPFTIDTRIPFTVGDFPACTDPGRQHRVSLRIYNLLVQVVSIPVLESGENAAGGGQLENVMLTCGRYVAYWNGSYLNSSQAAPAGVYLYRLEVDGRDAVKKMFKAR